MQQPHWNVQTQSPPSAPVRHLVYGLNPLISALRQNDLRIEPLLHASGIGRQLLRNPEGQLNPRQELTFWSLGVEALGGGHIGLELGRRYHSSTLGVLGLALLSSRDLRQFIETIFGNILMTWTFFAAEAREHRGLAVVSIRRLRDLGPLLRVMSDRDVAALCALFNEILGERLPLHHVHFMYRAPADTAPYEGLFGCPVAFGRSHNEIAFDAGWLNCPLPRADESIHRIFTGQCLKICRALGARRARFSELVRYNLLDDPSLNTCLESVADRLFLTPRTVQRKLAAEHTSFRNLVAEIRRNLAIEFLRESRLSVGEVAERLGYADLSGFSHAFRRWTGKSPSDYRESAGLAADR